MFENVPLYLSLIVFLPALVAIVIAFIPGRAVELIRWVTLGATVAVLVLCFAAFLVPDGSTYFEVGVAEMQSAFSIDWIPSFNINYFMGIDGISFPLVMLTAVITVFAMGASWSITKHVKAYCILFLLLETGMIGVFLALDFFLFFIFWEVMLLPMYFLIGVWGGPRRDYAAIKFFLYTLVGGVLMLIAILILYFSSDVRALASTQVGNGAASRVDWDGLHLGDKVNAQIGRATIGTGPGQLVLLRGPANADRSLKVLIHEPTTGTTAEHTHAIFDDATNTVSVVLVEAEQTAVEVAAAINSNPLLGPVVDAGAPNEGGRGTVEISTASLEPFRATGAPIHTFNMLALQAMGQHTSVFSQNVQWWAFLLLFLGFIVKVPSIPVHTWLPDAHVEAPTPISMILAGVLLKMGGYGIIRICYPMCPYGGYALMYLVCGLGVASMLYGAFAALAQKDFKRMVAYSSVSHMGYVVLGFGVWSATAGTLYNPDYWIMGVKGAMFQMIGHGISSAGMFFMVGVLYDRVHHRNLNEFGAIFGKMPVYTAMAIGIFFAGLGLPGLCGFIGEVLVVLSVWSFSYILAILSALVVVLTAGYILWAVQRVYLGVEYKGPHEEELHEVSFREALIGIPLFILAILYGVFPDPLALQYMDATVDRQVNDLAAWTQEFDESGAGEATWPSSNTAIAESPQPPQAERALAAEEPGELVAPAAANDSPPRSLAATVP